MGRQLWLTACLLYIGIAWGLVPSLARLATSEGADALNATFLQSLVGGVVLLALTLVRGKRFHLSWRHLWFYTVCGFAGTTIPTAIVFAAAPEVGAGMIAIIIALAPILTYFGALVLGLEPHGFWRLAGIGLGFAAVLLIVLPDLEIEVGSLTAWLLITLFIPICYAIESLIIALRRPPEGDAMMLVAGMLLSSALVLLPVVLPWRRSERHPARVGHGIDRRGQHRCHQCDCLRHLSLPDFGCWPGLRDVRRLPQHGGRRDLGYRSVAGKSFIMGLGRGRPAGGGNVSRQRTQASGDVTRISGVLAAQAHVLRMRSRVPTCSCRDS